MATAKERVEENIGNLQRAANDLNQLVQKWFAGKHPTMGSMSEENISAANKDALLNDAWDKVDAAKAAITGFEADLPPRP